jgi:uncharacterized protein
VSGAPRVGEGVRVVTTKWPDRPHWEHDAVVLGEDEHGLWLGAPAGTRCSRPGAGYDADQAFLRLVHPDRTWIASFYTRGGRAQFDVYVDITTAPVWRDHVVTAVDLDLDVVRGWAGRSWIDDEDEFADHRVRLGYPDDVVTTALATSESLLHAVRREEAPYDRHAPVRWFTALDGLVQTR